MLSGYGKREWLTILVVGAMLIATGLFVQWFWLAGLSAVVTFALLTFFRDPHRRIPTDRGVVVSPADGRVSSIHHVDHFEPFDGPALCVRIFLSVLNVHVNRAPCHSLVQSITYKPGQHLNALNPDSAQANESNLITLLHPTHRYPIAVVRQVAGLIARTIVCGVKQEQILQRGQRIGMIKFGSTTELYLPDTLEPQIKVKRGQRVYGGVTVLGQINAPQPKDPPVQPTVVTKPQAAAPSPV